MRGTEWHRRSCTSRCKHAHANTPWPSRRSFAITPGLASVARSRIEMGEFAIGQSVPRFEDPRLVKGGGRYVGDMVLPGMAFGYVLRSPHAHARIRSIDTAKAKASPGVLAVLTGADWQASGWGDLPVPGGLKRADGSPAFLARFPALVADRVRWVGDYVAFVVAE